MRKSKAFLAWNYKMVFLAIFMAVLVGLFSLLALKGSYSRYAQDDYCYGYRFRVDNFWEAQVKSYFGTTEYNSNRYSLTLFNGLAERIGGPRFAPFMPALLLLAWVGVLVYILFLLFRSQRQVLLSITAALGLVFCTFLVSPNLYQVLFWVSAANTYTTPAILITLAFARILQFTLTGKFTKWNMAEVVLLNLLAGGFSETLTAWQISLWVWMFAGLLLLSPKGLFPKARWPLLLAIAGTLIAIVIMLVNPTNAVRGSFYGAIHPLTGFLHSFSSSLLFIKRSLKLTPLPFAFIFFLGVWLSSQSNAGKTGDWKKNLLALAAVLVATFLLCAAVMAPSVILANSYPSDRMLLPATFGLMLAVFVSGWMSVKLFLPWVNRLLPQKVVSGALIAVAVVLLAWLGTTFAQVTDKLPLYQARAAAWDARQQLILQSKAAGQVDLTVPAFDSIYGITELGTNPGNWVNRCASWYYGVDSITAEDGYMGSGAYPIGK